MNGILVALIGLVSALLGGAIQAFATGKFEKTNFARRTKWELYSAYFVTLGELTFTDRRDQRHINAMASMAQIRGRIGITDRMMSSGLWGNVFRFSDLGSAQAQDAMAEALNAMRRDIGQPSVELTREDLRQIMFGSRETLQ